MGYQKWILSLCTAVMIALLAMNIAFAQDGDVSEAQTTLHTEQTQSDVEQDQISTGSLRQICNIFKPCPFPASCKNGRCVKSNGDGVECDVFNSCPFPASCKSGRCVKSNGDGVECNVFKSCPFPYSCKSGRCERN